MEAVAATHDMSAMLHLLRQEAALAAAAKADRAAGVRIVEFGVRTGRSSIALLAGLTDQGAKNFELISYDTHLPGAGIANVLQELAERGGGAFRFIQANTFGVETLPPTDLPHVDSLHAFPIALHELQLAGGRRSDNPHARHREVLACHGV